MPDPIDRSDPTGRSDDDHDDDHDNDADRRRAERIYREVGAENPDPVTRREAVEGELEDEGLSDAGGHIGEHHD
jgi:hypothetical protein